MATCLRRSQRLLSPGESLLYALLPTTSRTASRRLLLQPYQQQRGAKNSKEARRLPQGFNLDDVFRRESGDKASRERDRLSRFTLDEAINTRWVVVIDRLTRKQAAPQLLTAVLESIDRSTQSVRLLAPEGAGRTDPLVDVVNRQELIDRQSELDAKDEIATKKSQAKVTKQLELSWGISANDLEMKLKQLQKFLSMERTETVEILLAHKKRQRRADNDEAAETLEKIKARMEEIGAAERKMEGQIGATVTLVVEKKKAAVPKPDTIVEDVSNTQTAIWEAPT